MGKKAGTDHLFMNAIFQKTGAVLVRIHLVVTRKVVELNILDALVILGSWLVSLLEPSRLKSLGSSILTQLQSYGERMR